MGGWGGVIGCSVITVKNHVSDLLRSYCLHPMIMIRPRTTDSEKLYGFRDDYMGSSTHIPEFTVVLLAKHSLPGNFWFGLCAAKAALQSGVVLAARRGQVCSLMSQGGDTSCSGIRVPPSPASVAVIPQGPWNSLFPHLLLV